MKITFWQNMQSFYQAPHMLALARDFGVEVTWVVQQRISDERAKQGWPTLDLSGVRCVVAPSDEQVIQICKSASKGDVHILTGPRGFQLSMRAMELLRHGDSTIAALTENRDDPLGRSWIRNPLYRLDYMRFGRRLDFLLVMGYTDPHGGRTWFKRRGYPASRLFPYCYFPPSPTEQSPLDSLPNAGFQIVYVGQYIHRKGLDTLLSALSSLQDLPWQLTLIGSGPEEAKLRELAAKTGIDSRVVFHPNLPNDVAMRKVGSSDLLILPSRFDGWGVVVNEALLRGVPVICSDRCGAKDLLADPRRGGIFEAGSNQELANLLRAKIDSGPLSSDGRDEIRGWSKCISGSSAANYLMTVIKHAHQGGPRPLAPWQ